MTITVTKELDFNDLMDNCWSGALDTLNTVYENDKEDELMSLLSLDTFGSMPSMTEVNDVLWFESDWIFEQLGISEDDDDDDDDDDDGYDDDDDYDDDWDNDPRIDEKHDGDRFDFPERF